MACDLRLRRTLPNRRNGRSSGPSSRSTSNQVREAVPSANSMCLSSKWRTAADTALHTAASANVPPSQSTSAVRWATSMSVECTPCCASEPMAPASRSAAAQAVSYNMKADRSARRIVQGAQVVLGDYFESLIGVALIRLPTGQPPGRGTPTVTAVPAVASTCPQSMALCMPLPRHRP